ncbi:MAG: hypothetical protein WC401_05190 [Bacteroidales bacterium]|jgi:hypothetical protein
MKLWQIKAESLRLMFADSDVEFSETEFTDGSIYANPNTREKLVLMNSSIRRAIDLYYQYCGALLKTAFSGLDYNEETEEYANEISTSEIVSFDFPTRIDIPTNAENYILGSFNIPFEYNPIDKKIVFQDDFATYYESVIDVLVFKIYYKATKDNLPLVVDELTYDLSTLYIPEEVQRTIPLFVKSELSEEDEANIAQSAKNDFIRFLINMPRKSTIVRGKVRHSSVFNKRN